MAGTTIAQTEIGAGRPKIAFLEVVRGIAATIVVFQHVLSAQFASYALWSRDYLDLGRVGVVAFFVVSGYVIPLSLEHQSARVFVIRRFFRLFPMYWLVLTVYLVAGLVFPDISLVPVTPAVLILNILMVQGLTAIGTIIPTAWTLGIELVFYAQEFVAKLVGRLNQSIFLGYAWLGIFAASELACRLFHRDLPATPMLLLYTASVGHALFRRDHFGRTEWKFLLAAGLVVIPVFSFIGGNHDPEWPPFTYAASYLLGIALFFVFYSLRARASWRALVWLGGVSYAVYLIHPLVYRLVVLSGVSPVTCLVATLLLTLVISWSLHKFVELPFISMGKRVSATLATPTSS